MSVLRRKVTLLAALALLFNLNGCSSTLGNIGLGFGLGVAGTVGGLYCALVCRKNY
ncbi:hypothetical protein [Trinickia violacea]|uniref:hypothetical protein n=1 Tax=Trinickia violacea TaxID=2571746 RepID=UPI0015862F57|nr:hypothetical protein [Trinickia violacea]